jgi:hypothetical protein
MFRIVIVILIYRRYKNFLEYPVRHQVTLTMKFCRHIFYLFIAFFTIYSRYLKIVISKSNGCEYLKQVPSIDGSLELI